MAAETVERVKQEQEHAPLTQAEGPVQGGAPRTGGSGPRSAAAGAVGTEPGAEPTHRRSGPAGGLPVAIDAMGGDHAPREVVAGALDAHRRLGIPVLLVGQPGAFDAEGLDVIPATEVVGMAEEPGQAVRRKKDSSLVRAAEAVRDGRASAMLSAGNTGAAMAAALLRMGRLPGVARPAVATTLPVPGASPTVLLDSGANAECTPAWLVQFAQMGAAFSTVRFGITAPRVGLLSIGEEPGKGSPLVKETYRLLEETEGLCFIGNVEGRDLLTDDVDVVVTDGFTGNVALKSLEGALRFFTRVLLESLDRTEELRAAARVVLPALAPLADELDPESQGGAMLLGVDGVCVISHGASSAKAVANAARIAHELAAADMVGALAAAVGPTAHRAHSEAEAARTHPQAAERGGA